MGQRCVSKEVVNDRDRSRFCQPLRLRKQRICTS